MEPMTNTDAARALYVAVGDTVRQLREVRREPLYTRLRGRHPALTRAAFLDILETLARAELVAITGPGPLIRWTGPDADGP
jgi:hypothetical protein